MNEKKDALILKYFQNRPIKTFHPSEVLFSQGEFNDRLFLILEGELQGMIEINGRKAEFLRAKSNDLVGLYSFFSDKHLATSTITALKTTQVKSISARDESCKNTKQVREEFFEVIMDELVSRQNMIFKLQNEREDILSRMFEIRRFASLGELSAGVAHELNNALSVLENGTQWLFQWLSKSSCIHPLMEKIFALSVAKERKRVDPQKRQMIRDFAEKNNFSLHTARKLLELDFSNDSLEEIKKNSMIDPVCDFYESVQTLKDMQIASSQAIHVVSSMKNLGKAQSIEIKQINLSETIQHALILLKNQMQGIEIIVNLKDTAKICARAGDLIQVWTNLLKNACEAMKNAKTSHPRICIQSFCKSEKIFISIEDNGPGIPKENLSKVFSPNFTTKVEGLSFGLGLGLSITQKILSSIHARILVESEPGKTVFTIEFRGIS